MSTVPSRSVPTQPMNTDVSDGAKFVVEAAKVIEGFMAMSGKAPGQYLGNGEDKSG
ncbi:hypothetical protein VE02_04335 [Pseudogymnoascus sp. 03VT05]|nr:hypothetical protein VE02_04335 [Pseudogymnoascus sp. 03VT05]